MRVYTYYAVIAFEKPDNILCVFFYILKYSSKTYLIPRAYSTLKSAINCIAMYF